MRLENEVLTKINGNGIYLAEAIGEDHVSTSKENPIRENAFLLTDKEKLTRIEQHFKEIMDTLGLDLNDESLKGTPYRVAKMFVKEIFQGLDPRNKPISKVFDNNFKYGQMLVEKNITVNTLCEHHFLPIIGKAHVAYISTGKVIGLSKINRTVNYFSRRPQVQERLTVQIAEEMKKALQTEDVAVLIEAKHMCVSFRGIEDKSSSTITVEYSGKFKENEFKREFLKYIDQNLVKE